MQDNLFSNGPCPQEKSNPRLLASETETLAIFFSYYVALCIAHSATKSYAAFVDPGQVDGDSVDVEKGMPLRAHKSWQYPQPVQRYDHFCRSWAVKTMR